MEDLAGEAPLSLFYHRRTVVDPALLRRHHLPTVDNHFRTDGGSSNLWFFWSTDCYLPFHDLRQTLPPMEIDLSSPTVLELSF